MSHSARPPNWRGMASLFFFSVGFTSSMWMTGTDPEGLILMYPVSRFVLAMINGVCTVGLGWSLVRRRR